MHSSTSETSPERAAAPEQHGEQPHAGEPAPRLRHVASYFDLVPTPIRREYISAWAEPRVSEGVRGLRRSSFRSYQESTLPLE